MKAVCWMGVEKINVENVPDPKIIHPRDAIVRITSTCICGSDVHLYNGYIPIMEQGDILGHKFMGEVVEVGGGIDRDKLKVGDRVVVSFTIACGRCFFKLARSSSAMVWNSGDDMTNGKEQDPTLTE